MPIWQHLYILWLPAINPLKHHNGYGNFQEEDSNRSAWLNTGCNNRLKG